jgi:hypothetical protein
MVDSYEIDNEDLFSTRPEWLLDLSLINEKFSKL